MPSVYQKISDRFHIPVVDLKNYSGTDMRAMWYSFTPQDQSPIPESCSSGWGNIAYRLWAVTEGRPFLATLHFDTHPDPTAIYDEKNLEGFFGLIKKWLNGQPAYCSIETDMDGLVHAHVITTQQAAENPAPVWAAQFHVCSITPRQRLYKRRDGTRRLDTPIESLERTVRYLRKTSDSRLLNRSRRYAKARAAGEALWFEQRLDAFLDNRRLPKTRMTINLPREVPGTTNKAPPYLPSANHPTPIQSNPMTQNPFTLQLARGHSSEASLLKTLMGLHSITQYDLPQDRANRAFDLSVTFGGLWPTWATSATQTLEVKRDGATTSSNLPITVFKLSQPSNDHEKGILPSRPDLSPNFGLYRALSDMYVVHNPAAKIFYVAQTTRLKNLLENSPALRYTTTYSMDYEQRILMGLILLPKALWLEHFTTIPEVRTT